MSEKGFALRMKAFWIDARLQTHDQTRTMREVCALRRKKFYTDKDHEEIRDRYKKELTEVRNDPMFNA